MYSSAMDGLGTPKSDLDVYAIRDVSGSHENGTTLRVSAGEVAPQGRLDIEWWDIDNVVRICGAAKDCRARLDDLKVLHRLQAGITLKPPQSGGVRSVVGGIQLRRPVITCLSLLMDDEIRSYEGFASAGDWQAGLLTARRAATYATMAWCAHEGQLLFKEKWLMPALERSRPEMAAKYWTAMSLFHESDAARVLDFAFLLKSAFDGHGISLSRMGW